MIENISTDALRSKASRKGCKVSVHDGMAALYIWNHNVGWLHAEDYCGPLTHPWTLQEVSEMLDEQ